MTESVESVDVVPLENQNETANGLETESSISKLRSGRVNSQVKKKTKSRKENWVFAPHEKPGPMTREDVSCPICLSIYIEPVTFPCKHSLCKECFGTYVRETSLYCPICRCRLSIWSRNATKTNSLVHTAFWERINKEFPAEVAARLAGEDSQDIFGETETGSPAKVDGTFALHGEIRKEFDIILTQFNQEVEKEKVKEIEATNEFLRQLQDKEGPPIEIQLESDFELAKRLQKEEEDAFQLGSELRHRHVSLPPVSGSRYHSPTLHQRSSATSSSKRKSCISSFSQSKSKRPCLTMSSSQKQPSIMNFFEKILLRSGKSDSKSNTPDSINSACNQHFRPIACAPRTPPKRNEDRTFQEAVLVKSLATRRSLMLQFEASDQDVDKKRNYLSDIVLEIRKKSHAENRMCGFVDKTRFVTPSIKVESEIASTSAALFHENAKAQLRHTANSSPVTDGLDPIVSFEYTRGGQSASLLNRSICPDSESNFETSSSRIPGIGTLWSPICCSSGSDLITDSPEKALSISMQESDYDDDTSDEIDFEKKYPGLKLLNSTRRTSPAPSSCESGTSVAVIDDHNYAFRQMEKDRLIEKKYPGLKLLNSTRRTSPAPSSCESGTSVAVIDDHNYAFRQMEKDRLIQEEKDRKIAAKLQKEFNKMNFVERNYSTRSSLGKIEKKKWASTTRSKKNKGADVSTTVAVKAT